MFDDSLMADLNRYLRRFWRLVSPPGRPGPAAVPADRVQTIAEEIGPVLEIIDAVQAEADRVRADAEQEAHRRRDAAERETTRIVVEARACADEERAGARAGHRHDIEVETDAALAAARDEASALRSRAKRNVETFAATVLAQLLDDKSETTETGPWP